MEEKASCVGCSLPIEDGSIIAFGEALFHLNCFVCTKCTKPVNCDANLLLLTNGRPVCEDCSYVCTSCKNIIHDEAIMTGDEVYHADCFKCVSCNEKINNLVFTPTSKGIFCTPCYEKRRAEKHKRREKRQQQKLLVSTLENTISNEKYTRGSSLDVPSSSMIQPRPSQSDTLHKSSSSSSPISTTSNTSLSTKPIINSNLNPKKKSIRLSRLDFSTSDFPSLNLSFFENDSVDILNLTSSLGANLSLDNNNNSQLNLSSLNLNKSTPPLPQQQQQQQSLLTSSSSSSTKNVSNTLNRASDMLRSSLNFFDFPNPPERSNGLDDSQKSPQQLESELRLSKKKLADMETNFNKIKDASQRALDEFSKAKEEFGKELELRQQHEISIAQLRRQLVLIQQMHTHRDKFLPLNQMEMEGVAQIRIDLEMTCHELRSHCDRLATDIESFVQQKQAGLVSDPVSHLHEQQRSLLVEINMLKKEKESLRTETAGLTKLRDDVITDMIMLNTKIAELSEMNNSLSRRVIEREREAAAVLAGTSFLSDEMMQRKSSEMSYASSNYQDSSTSSTTMVANETPKVASRDSYNGILTPKMFKIKKVNVFGSNHHKTSSSVSSSATSSPSPPTPIRKDSSSSISPNGMNVNGDYFNHQNHMNASTLNFMNKQSQDGTHAFLPTTFYKSVKCEGCTERMKWGVSELKCQICSLSVHTRCLGSVPAVCYENIPQDENKGQSMFGNDLTSQAQLENRTIPLVVDSCIEAVEARGMDYEGIYRKSGGAAQMRLIQQGFDRGEIDLMNDEIINDICAVTSVLKTYLRELPDPLMTYELYPQWIDIVTLPDGPDKLETFCELLLKLPKTNYDTLAKLIYHLDKVQQYNKENLMTTRNLAMVFGPTLLRDQDATRDLIDMGSKNATIEYLINNVYELF
ncbi:unnamed protein product [Cunninghamella blakesleeana]